MTDVSVNHLNSRLALQLPPELPLGLVFVVGRVENLNQTADNKSNPRTKFELVEKDHSIQCELSARAARESNLTTGMRVRAGGHLAFDSHRARYFLLARDIEMISPSSVSGEDSLESQTNGVHKTLGRQALTPILADIKRRAEAADLEEAQLPYWVKKLAPSEVQEELQQLEPVARATAVPPSPPPLDNKLIDVLSEAMDSDEEVELTSEMLVTLAPTAVPAPLAPTKNDPYQIPAALSSTSPSQQNLLLPIILLVFTLLLLAVLLTFFFAGA